jgi:hypothetical protein
MKKGGERIRERVGASGVEEEDKKVERKWGGGDSKLKAVSRGWRSQVQ